jgi:hypothetical protein
MVPKSSHRLSGFLLVETGLNILFVYFLKGALSTTASNTLTRVGGYVLSLDTANLPEFKSIIDLATAGYTAATSTMSKNTFSRLSELLLPILVNVVRFPLLLFCVLIVLFFF